LGQDSLDGLRSPVHTVDSAVDDIMQRNIKTDDSLKQGCDGWQQKFMPGNGTIARGKIANSGSDRPNLE